MNYITHFNVLGTEALQIPCITNVGAPDTSTEGAIGCLYVDTLTGDLYVCTSAWAGEHTWKKIKSSLADLGITVSASEINGIGSTVRYTEQSLTDVQKSQVRTNTGASRVFVQASAPTNGMTEGDIWFDGKAGGTFSTDKDELVSSVISALPKYAGEVTE